MEDEFSAKNDKARKVDEKHEQLTWKMKKRESGSNREVFYWALPYVKHHSKGLQGSFRKTNGYHSQCIL